MYNPLNEIEAVFEVNTQVLAAALRRALVFAANLDSVLITLIALI
ncbi:MAG: hypothetical protein ACI93R_001874 [Flavobacteriales bacterium]|jgi:hypothetical protein